MIFYIQKFRKIRRPVQKSGSELRKIYHLKFFLNRILMVVFEIKIMSKIIPNRLVPELKNMAVIVPVTVIIYSW